MSDEEVPASVDGADATPGSQTSVPSPPRERNGCIFLAVAILLFFAFIGGGVAIYRSTVPEAPPAENTQTPSTPTSSKPIPVGTTAIPNVVGTSQDAAESALDAAGFVPLTTFITTSTATPGDVLAQVPIAGTGLAEGSEVSIAVAKAVQASALTPIAVPNVYLLKRPEAQSVLMSSGFSPVFAEIPSVEVTGAAVAQQPTAQESALAGAAILVLMSNGHEPQAASVAIPSVIGKSEAEATQELTAVHLSSQILRGFNTAVKGSVFGQLPPAGGQVAPNTPIALAVSLGQLPAPGRDVVVPDVTKMDAARAYDTLTKAGLLVQQAYVTSPALPAGKAVGQLPLAGWTVPAGSIVIVSATLPR